MGSSCSSCASPCDCEDVLVNEEFPLTSNTLTCLTLLKVKRSVIEAVLPKGVELASADEIKQVHPDLDADDFAIGLQCDRNTEFGPLIGPFIKIDFNMFMTWIPYCKISVAPGFWTYRYRLSSSSIVSEIMTGVGYGAAFEPVQLVYPPSQPGSMASYGISSPGDWQNEGVSRLLVTWQAGNLHAPTEVERKEPGLSFVLEMLKQPWFADPSLKVGSAFTYDPDLQFSQNQNIQVNCVDDRLILPGVSGTLTGQVLTSLEAKITLHEAKPFNIADRKPAPMNISEKDLYKRVMELMAFEASGSRIKKGMDLTGGEMTKEGKEFLRHGGELFQYLKRADDFESSAKDFLHTLLAFFEKEFRDAGIEEEAHIPEGFRPFNPPWDHSTLFTKIAEAGANTDKVFTAIADVTDAVKKVQSAIDEKGSITVAATMYGGTFSQVSMPANLTTSPPSLLSLNHMKDIEYLTASTYPLNPSNKKALQLATVTNGRCLLVKIGAGVTIAVLNEFLWPVTERRFDNAHEKNGYGMVQSSPGWFWMSYMGTSQCAANGSGTRTPSMESTILSLDIVLVLDKVATLCRVEPSGDRALTKSTSSLEGIKLIQDADLFEACVCGVGSMGVIVSAVIQCEPAAWCLEQRIKQTREKTVEEIPKVMEMNDKGELYKFEIWLSPYPFFWQSAEQAPTLMSKWYPLEVGSDEWNKYTKGKEYKGLEQRPSGLTLGLPLLKAGEWLAVVCSNHASWLMPFVMDITLETTQAPEPIPLAIVDARYFGSVNQASAAPLTSGEFLDASDAKFIQDAAVSFSEHLLQLYKEKQMSITSPWSLRFGEKSSALISPLYNRPSCLLENPLLLGTFRGQELLNLDRDFLQSKWGARPHWGLNNGDGITAEMFKQFYPDTWQKFVQLLKKFGCHPATGEMVFGNAFMKNTLKTLL